MENILIWVIAFSSIILTFGIYCLIYSNGKIKSASEKEESNNL